MSETATQPRYTALLADDVPELRRLLRHVLEWSERFSVIAEAEDGAQAIDLVAALKPDLVLLDISMPVMDGIEALPRILAAAPGTKVVILSGFEAERLAERATAEGACAYLEKGIPPALLVKQLLGVLEGGNGDIAAAPRRAHSAPGAAPVLDVSPEEMMSLVAHEVRNPLAVIQGFGTELQARWDVMPDAQRRDAVRRMTERARYLSTLVNNLMFLRRLESARGLSQNAGAHDMRSFFDALRDELDELARGHRLEVEVPPYLPPAHLDLVHLRQVLTNLVVNAAKFSPADEPIRIEAFEEDGWVVIRVADAGPGIPPEMREEVFAKFRRLSHAGSGIGLGLFISRALMTSMGGELWIADSERGADLRLRLRIAT